MTRRILGALLLLCSPLTLAAQAPARGAGWVDGYLLYQHVSGGFGDWKGTGIRLAAPAGAAVFYGDLLAQEAFGDRGEYGAAGLTVGAGRDWVLAGSVGGGSGDFVFPELRLDASLGRKWLRSRQLVTTLGVTYVDARQGFEDVAVTGSAALYVGRVVLEAGGRWNWSDPGDNLSRRGFASVTVGRDGAAWVAVRGSTGREAYQLAGAQTLREFTSHEASVRWRQWIGGRWGTVLSAEVYDNPFYSRVGGSVGLFRSW